LHRLRKLLGDDHAIVVDAGVLRLNRERVWTDVDATMQLCEHVEELAAPAPLPLIERLASQLLAIYKGHLDQDGDDPWIVACGSRLRVRFVAAAHLLGSRLEACGQWQSAGRLYRRMLDADPLCEVAYRGLMRVAHAQGDLASAYSHFRFCRDTLSIVLNRPPSADTRALAETLGLFEQIVRAPDCAVPAHVATSITSAAARTNRKSQQAHL